MKTKLCESCHTRFEPHRFCPSQRFCTRECWNRCYTHPPRPLTKERREYKRKWMYDRRERFSLTGRIYRIKHPEIARLYRQRNRERRNDYNRKWRNNNLVRVGDQQRRSYLKNGERYKIGDYYITKLLQTGTTLQSNDFPPEIVELKRKQIRLLRAIRKTKNPCTLNKSAA